MDSQKQKSPNLAERGFSNNIHQDQLANQRYHTMITDNPNCQRFCVQLLERFDGLLERFSPSSPHVYHGRELDAFVALVNLEKSIDSPRGNMEANQ